MLYKPYGSILSVGNHQPPYPLLHPETSQLIFISFKVKKNHCFVAGKLNGASWAALANINANTC